MLNWKASLGSSQIPMNVFVTSNFINGDKEVRQLSFGVSNENPGFES